MARIDLDALRERLAERLANQTEAHHGGSKHIGTGGTSPFGHSGWHPGGIRIGGEGRNRTAAQIAAERRFREYRSDETLGVREMGVALRRLRRLTTRLDGPATELDLDATIDATADAGGGLRLQFRRPRRNAVRVLLLLDVGGSMDEHAAMVDRLFSAVHQGGRFRDLTVRYFHNCVYDRVYESARLLPSRSEPTLDLLARMSPDHKLVVVGDACMAPSELAMVGGAIDYHQHNDEPGWVWLERLADRFAARAWLNPVPGGLVGPGARRAHARRRADDLPDVRAVAGRPRRGGRRADGGAPDTGPPAAPRCGVGFPVPPTRSEVFRRCRSPTTA